LLNCFPWRFSVGFAVQYRRQAASGGSSYSSASKVTRSTSAAWLRNGTNA
jgi:hypothetical protein